MARVSAYTRSGPPFCGSLSSSLTHGALERCRRWEYQKSEQIIGGNKRKQCWMSQSRIYSVVPPGYSVFLKHTRPNRQGLMHCEAVRCAGVRRSYRQGKLCSEGADWGVILSTSHSWLLYHTASPSSTGAWMGNTTPQQSSPRVETQTGPYRVLGGPQVARIRSTVSWCWERKGP